MLLSAVNLHHGGGYVYEDPNNEYIIQVVEILP